VVVASTYSVLFSSKFSEVLTGITTSRVLVSWVIFSSFSSKVASNLALKGVLLAEAFPTFEDFSLVADALFETVLLTEVLVAD
jgi:hypothetical protein